MHTIDTENQFIELRAKGLSLSRISTQIRVSQRTLVDWNRKHHVQIQELRSIAFEAMKERILATQEQELTILNNHLQRIEKELSQRHLRFVPVASLFRVCAILRKEIRNMTLPPDPLPPLEPETPNTPAQAKRTPPPQAPSNLISEVECGTDAQRLERGAFDEKRSVSNPDTVSFEEKDHRQDLASDGPQATSEFRLKPNESVSAPFLPHFSETTLKNDPFSPKPNQTNIEPDQNHKHPK